MGEGEREGFWYKIKGINYILIPNMKWLGGKKFVLNEEVIIPEFDKSYFLEGLHKVEK